MKIAAVIVTHNRLDRLRVSLAAALTESFDTIWVIDCASTDGTQDYLSGLDDPRLNSLRLSENVGGAGGFHEGIKAARALADWIVLFDDDARPATGAIDRFRALADGTDAAAVVARVDFPDGRICDFNRPGLNPFWRRSIFLRSLRQGPRPGMYLTDAQLGRRQPPRPIDFASFVGFFLRTSVIDDVGLPDPELFIYGDDTSFCLRLRRSGHRIIAAPAIRFIHDCADQTERMVFLPLWKVYYMTRNSIGAIWLATGAIWILPALVFSIALWILRARLYPPALRLTYLRLIFEGMFDGFCGVKGRKPRVHNHATSTIPLTLPARHRLVAPTQGNGHASKSNFSQRRSG